jgi:hypothetical protein
METFIYEGKSNRRFDAPTTLGEWRALAIVILKEHTDIPDRATLFTNRAGALNVNWKSLEAEALELKESEERLRKTRVIEAKAISERLKELKELGI